jgi:hypothetical protein
MIRTAVFTHWAVPNYLNRYCGFNTREDFISSFVLAIYCAKMFFKKVVLFTDKQGHRELDPFLQLFDEVHLDIEILNTEGVPRSLWAYPKMITYAAQKEPFLHIDNDVFFWERPPLAFLHQELVCQSVEYKMPMYDFCFKRIMESPLRHDFSQFSNLFKKLGWMVGINKKKVNNPVLTPNFGIFGGTDVDFIQKYANKVLTILRKKENIAYLKAHDLGDSFNAIYEQWFFGQETFASNRIVVPLLEPPPGYHVCNRIDMKRDGAQIYKGSKDVKYTHLVAGSKRDPYMAKRVRAKAQRMLPPQLVKFLSS